MYIDLAFLVMAALGFLTGYRKGILHSVFFLLGLVLGVYGALNFSLEASEFLSERFDIDPHYLPLLSFVLVFLLITGLLLFLATALEAVLKALKLNMINKLSGALVWLMLSLFIFSTALWFMARYQLLPQDELQRSLSYPLVESYSPELIKKLEALGPIARETYVELDSLINRDIKEQQ